ncbi:MAG: hypothetical protein MH472_14165 [Bacteroidia bacterium]|nr:hypothetical protein [Bacteroidia bacterium]
MRYLFSLLIIMCGFGLMAQEKPKQNPEIKRFVYQANTQITKRVYDSIYFDVNYDAGSKWVFKFSHQFAEYEMISDDEYFESFEFEMDPPKGNSFVIKQGDFEKHKVIYNRSCFCPDAGPRALSKGTIKGKRIRKNTWLVEFDGEIVARPGKDFAPYPRKWKGYFKPNKLIY